MNADKSSDLNLSILKMDSLLLLEHRGCAGGHCGACRQEAIRGILHGFPACTSLGPAPVYDGKAYHAGFDMEEVEKALGTRRFRAFLAGLKEDFICNHRVYPEDYPDKNLRGTVPHCCRVQDLEDFLTAEPEVSQPTDPPISTEADGTEPLWNRLTTWLRRWSRKLRI